MRKSLYIVMLAAGLVFCVLSIGRRGSQPEKSPLSAPTKAAEERRPPRAEEERLPPEDGMLTARLYPIGVPDGALRRAGLQAERIERATARYASGVATPRWTFVGPANIGGRVLDLAIDPVRANTIYIAAASGGVWKSADAGATCTAIWPGKNAQAIGAIAIASDGTLYAGTGEAGPGGGSLTYGGDGIYRSKDRGATWKLVGLTNSGTIGRIVIDPKNPKRIFAAVAGSLFTPGGERGVYRSVDGGDTWKRVLAPVNKKTGAADLAIDPSNSKRLYVAMWEHMRYPDLRAYGGAGSGIYRSVDGGTTWKRLGGGLPDPSPQIGRIGIAVARSNPNRVYAIVVKANGSFHEFYVSNNRGETWSPAPRSGSLTESQSTYGWWFGRVWVDPADADHVFVGGVPLMESANGGSTWVEQWDPHVDHHAMAWDPRTSGRVYLGNDGGIYRSDSRGSSGWIVARSQPFTQYYTLDVSELDTTRIVGGTQDNGVTRSYPASTGWNMMLGGDGEAVLINYLNQNLVYGCYQYGNCYRSSDGGETITRMSATSQRFNWLSPLQFDPNNPSIMYFGGNLLNRSTDGGVTWQVISQDLSGGPGRDNVYPFGTITTVAAAKTDGRVLYVGTDDGRLWVTKNLGQNWTRAVDADLPSHWITRVAVDPADANTAYATYSGYRSGNNGAYVLKTGDGGTSWTNITGNLPQAPVNDIIVFGSTLYVSTDIGVYMRRTAGETWLKLGEGLPRVPVTDIRLHVPTKALFAATFGRGIYRIVVPSS